MSARILRAWTVKFRDATGRDLGHARCATRGQCDAILVAVETGGRPHFSGAVRAELRGPMTSIDYVRDGAGEWVCA